MHQLLVTGWNSSFQSILSSTAVNNFSEIMSLDTSVVANSSIVIEQHDLRGEATVYFL